MSDVGSVSELFNKYFSEIGLELERNIPVINNSNHNPLSYLPDPIIGSMFLGPITCHEVVKLTKSLNPGSSTGSDEISSNLLKKILNAISIPLTELFNCSFTQAIVPDCFKVAVITPVHKSGDTSLVSNYRPISVISQLAKLLEKCYYVRLIKFIKSKDYYWH